MPKRKNVSVHLANSLTDAEDRGRRRSVMTTTAKGGVVAVTKRVTTTPRAGVVMVTKLVTTAAGPS